MRIWEAGKLYNRVRGWIVLAMLAFLVLGTMAYAVREALWPDATAPQNQKPKQL